MNKKIVVVLIVCLFIGASILPTIGGYNESNLLNNPDELDQEQPWCYEGGALIYDCFYYAQAFIPTLNTLTRVELALAGDQNETTTLSPLIISIRKDLTGEDLTSVTIPIENIGPFLHLMSVDFPDIFVIPETTYYIVASTTAGGWDGSYWWSYCWQQTYYRGFAWNSSNCGSTWSLVTSGLSNSDLAAFIFRTYGYNTEENNPPYIPSNPYPEDGAINIPTDIVLTWSGGDPDIDDTVTYDVYFGSMLPLQKVASNITTALFNPETLANSLTYYWNVVAWDNHGASTIGPGWCFTTINATNHPPDTPSIIGKTNGKAGVEYEYCLDYAVDIDGDSLYVWWDWGDGTNTGWLGSYDSGEPMCATHSWSEEGTYTIKARLKDPYGAESDWASLEVSMPKDKKKIENTDSKVQINNDKQFVFLSGKCNKYHGDGTWLHIGPIWWINGTFSFDLYKNILLIANGTIQYIDNSVCVTFTNFRGYAPGFLLVLKVLIPGTYIRVFGICDNYNIIEL